MRARVLIVSIGVARLAAAAEFAFFFAPLKLEGATGSPGNPIAIR
jgi:hypothetical protein